MNREELFNLLEIDNPEDFEYFEQFAELIECEDDIEFEDFFLALSKISSRDLSEINENYFTELEKGFPSEYDEMLEVIHTVWNNLKLLLPDIDEYDYRREYAQQLFDFHNMYVKEDGARVDGRACSVLEAVAENRASKIENTNHVFDFENSEDFCPDYVSIKLGGFEDNGEY